MGQIQFSLREYLTKAWQGRYGVVHCSIADASAPDACQLPYVRTKPHVLILTQVSFPGPHQIIPIYCDVYLKGWHLSYDQEVSDMPFIASLVRQTTNQFRACLSKCQVHVGSYTDVDIRVTVWDVGSRCQDGLGIKD